MTINDIAGLAGVSVSTVSKIINGKDAGIKNETRERVLKIVKDYRYKPYDFIKKNTGAKNFLLGLLLSGTKKRDSFQRGFLHEAEKRGYQVQVCLASSAESELKHIAALCKNRADAILRERIAGDDVEALSLLHKSGISCVLLGEGDSEDSISYDYKKAGYDAAKIVITSGHTKIHCLYDPTDERQCAMRSGVERCLFDNHCLSDEYGCLQEALTLHGCSALICCTWDTALAAYEYAALHKFRIPHDVSVLCIDDAENIKSFPSLSALPLPLFDFGAFACDYMINKIEKKKNVVSVYAGSYSCKGGGSIDLPFPLRKKRIIVAGSINTDILLAVKNYPQTGESISADNVSILPGGKGINQAVGAAKLGAKVSLIGKVGRDFDGDMILNVLYENGVDTSAVEIDGEKSTGKAYIHVQEDGESGIVLYGGANESVSAETVYRNESLFTDATFCLLQTEIPTDAVQAAVRVAHKNNVAIMLKPSAAKTIDDALLRDLDYFIPNRKELYRLCPAGNSLEEKADLFLEKGVKTVIVTLGSGGCYVRTREVERYFPAAGSFDPVDTTGAADAFISALAVFLSENKSLADALQYAAYAAGFSTTRVGVVPSLVDRATLEHFITCKKP
ncbi:PfkB family carbohydrate kinase [Treponema sp. SP13]|uniref:PfkB family carbohydrate kinase n=1 Tax=Treponema sp. SP13 TaxID=2789742 RepID=UPI003D8A2A45